MTAIALAFLIHEFIVNSTVEGMSSMQGMRSLNCTERIAQTVLNEFARLLKVVHELRRVGAWHVLSFHMGKDGIRIHLDESFLIDVRNPCSGSRADCEWRLKCSQVQL
jgi:hypothetical protein